MEKNVCTVMQIALENTETVESELDKIKMNMI